MVSVMITMSCSNILRSPLTYKVILFNISQNNTHLLYFFNYAFLNLSEVYFKQPLRLSYGKCLLNSSTVN